MWQSDRFKKAAEKASIGLRRLKEGDVPLRMNEGFDLDDTVEAVREE